ncbi:hypothetical protein MNBD_CPR01-330 [hydrothermal vent metagenome]|uniref:Prepilin peptidase A24 N-terminal domain-containing protein n=1 Tax=hydrothermal vent metagenome TaxID=652676 RepID=A0A3B0UNW5_9ZZZZ
MEFVTMFAVIFFALGAIIASFLGVVVDRWDTGESWLLGRSHCDSCSNELSVTELVPIASWVFLRGRCKQCGSRISARSTITETVLGTLFVLSYLKLGLTLSLAVFLVALSVLALIVAYDLLHTIIPGEFSVLFVLSSIIYAGISAQNVSDFGVVFLVSAGLALMLVAIHFASRGRAMGLGDAPVTFGLALIAGSLAFSGFLYSFWVGAFVGIIILLRTPVAHRIGIEVPFAPFLATGFLIAFFTGWNIFMYIV